jgi:hypothetical protein
VALGEQQGSERSYANALTSRRGFLALAGAGAAAVVFSRDASGVAAAYPALPATANASVVDGVQRFKSRPDLLAPEVVIDTPAAGALGGLVVTESHGGAPQSGPLIVDQTGRIVWFNPLAQDPTAPMRAFNVSVQEYRGQPVLCWFEGVVVGSHGVGYGQGQYRIVDTNYKTIATVTARDGYRGDLHEFQLTPQGTALFTCYGLATARMRIGGKMRSVPYAFGVVQEVDVATGKLLFHWRSDRHIQLTESLKAPVLKPGWLWDYMHINSISVDPSDNNLVISGRNTCACYKVDRKTGRVIWRLGGKKSDFKMAANTRFHFQHDVNIHPGGLLTVFDNEGGPPQEASQSRALLLSVDQRHMRVTLKHAFHHQPAVYSDALGSVQPLPDGRWFVGWGRSTYFTKYTQTGEVLFDGHLTPGASSYRAFLQSWNATPTSPPDVAAVGAGAGAGATVYASWNGSTALARWVVVGGSDPGSLSGLGQASVAGFETAISLPSAPSWIAVSACDSSGRVLSTSQAVRVQ